MTPSRHQSAASDVGGVPRVATPRDDVVAHGHHGRQRRRFSLAFRHWRVRSKLVAILLIPLLAVLGFAGLRLRDVLEAQRQAHRAEQMAQFTRQVIVLARALEAERDQSAVNLGSSHQTGGTDLKAARDATDKQVREYQRQVTALNIRSLGPVLSDTVGTIDSHIGKLNGLHLSVDTNGDWPSVDAEYQSFVSDLLSVEQNITQGSGDPDLNDAVLALAAVSRYTAAADSERGLVGFLIANGAYSESDRTEVFRRDAQETVAKGVVDSTLTTPQRKIYDKALPETVTNPVNRLEDDKILPTSAGQRLPVTIDDWYKVSGTRLQALAGVEDQIARQVLDRTQELGKAASRQALTDGLIVLAILLATIGFGLLTVRSLVRPLRRLRSQALDVAYAELPSAVQRMRDTDQVDAPVTSVSVGSRDEVGEVAQAFDSVHREAVRHAGEQALLRRNVSTMFVNLSRRTQSLVERQLRLIDTLEGGEQDPDSLENLFQLDHLATRMRRNAENLLVLAGAEPGRRWAQPVALIDVLRAAAAEVEQYQRVVHTFVTGREIEGRAVGDVVHLVAELLENASEFSPPDSHVVVSARSMSGGAGVMIEIEDQGIGMSAEDMATANERLSATAEFEPQLSRMMGLYVVGRLAVRHGIRVQLRPAPSGGLTALIHLPPEVVVDPMSQTGSDLPPMTAPVAGMPMLESGEDLAHPGTGMPGPVQRPEGPPAPAVPLPSFGLAGLTAGAAAVPRPPAARSLPPVLPPGMAPGMALDAPPNRFGPAAEVGRPVTALPGMDTPPNVRPGAARGTPPGAAPGFPPGMLPVPAAVPSGPPPLPRREPNTAWPPAGVPPQHGETIGLTGHRGEPDEPTESIRPLLPSRESVARIAPEPDRADAAESIGAALAGEPDTDVGAAAAPDEAATEQPAGQPAERPAAAASAEELEQTPAAEPVAAGFPAAEAEETQVLPALPVRQRPAAAAAGAAAGPADHPAPPPPPPRVPDGPPPRPAPYGGQ